MQCLRNKRSELSKFYVCECGFGDGTYIVTHDSQSISA